METVVTLVVTYKRDEQVMATLRAVLGQTRTPDQVVVVDNGSSAELEDKLRRLGGIDYLDSGSNLGHGGGLNAGMRWVEASSRPDWYWVLDDDSPPSPVSLEEALRVAADGGDTVGLVATRGGNIRLGRVRHDYQNGAMATPVSAGFALVDGSLIRGDAVRRVGLPRPDFFIMMEDLEYSTRIHSAGYEVIIRPSDGSVNLYQGSGAPWRGYYQSRNHLRMAIERRSISWLFGWIYRESAINLHHFRHQRFGAIKLRMQGARDAVRNRMGRTVAPS